MDSMEAGMSWSFLGQLYSKMLGPYQPPWLNTFSRFNEVGILTFIEEFLPADFVHVNTLSIQ
jgi:hypothetical protein